ncbi:hypothetical protein [Amycolatopsis japonica]|uniref:hypothetical protein n=1 Tax=Amycolatopsis japonica TaxID=208439 RepID=UPI003D9E3AFF
MTERLATGPGAIYWHVPNKGALLDAATASVVAIGLSLFEAIERHPWLSSQLALQLSRSPRGSVTPRIFEAIGQRVSALGIPETTWFTGWEDLDPSEFPFLRSVAAEVREHDDREQFLAGMTGGSRRP